MKKEHGLSVFERRVLKTLLGPKREEITVYVSKLHSEVLYDLLSLPSITWAIKSIRVRWVGHVAYSGRR